MFDIRNEIENAIKKQNLNRKNFFETSKLSYKVIIDNIENTFVDKSQKWDKDIHWVNMGHYKRNLPVRFIPQSTVSFVELLPLIIPNSQKFLYFLVEGHSKYWIYEGKIQEIYLILNETSFYDFYIVSKKYDWLISQNHHDCWSFVGDTLNLSVIPN